VRYFVKDYAFDSANLNMTEDERLEISSYIEKEFGIKMPEAKKPLLTGRLSKRLRHLKMKSFSEYFDLIHMPQHSDEYRTFIDLVSTHETSFFREASHFDYLMETALPHLMHAGVGTQRPLSFLSAACSTGEEMYSMAIVLEEFAVQQRIRNFKYHLIGTDISVNVLQTAARGVYKSAVIEKIPLFAHKYFMRSKDSRKDAVRIIPEIRMHIECMEMNLLDAKYPFDYVFDVIFCRNVMIYFNRKTQERVARTLCRHLSPEGYLFVGHSESLLGFPLDIETVAPATYILSSK
jgi:chemotaxis protein methyltransferase CheR